MRRTGIDLSSTKCFVVDAERRRGRAGEGIRLHGIATLPSHGGAPVLVPKLEALIRDRHFPRRAWVNLWDVKSVHQYVFLPSASPAELEATVRQRAARALGLSEREVTTSVGSTRSERGRSRTEVVFFAASTQELSERLMPIEVAGFLVEGVTTTCGALWSQALLRRSERTREVQAYVALGTSQSAIAICCGGTLLCARDLDWGHAYDAAGEAVALERDDLADKLSLELRHSFLYLKQDWDEEVSRVLLLGDMPEIRSLTVPMIERLNIEVEPLDTLSGYDLLSLPPRFSDQAAAFRLASGIVAAPSPSTLLRAGVEGGHVLPSAKWIVAGTAAAVVALLAFLYIRSQNEREEAQRSLPVVEGQNRPADSANEPEPRIRPEDMAAATIDDQVPQAPRPQAPTPVPAPIPNPQSPIPTPNPVHRLTGIVIGGGRRLALIDGRVVEVGDRVETDTVREIDPGAVVLSNEAGEERLLKLERSAEPLPVQ